MKGHEICELVYEHLNLSEGEYFGIQYYDKHDIMVSVHIKFKSSEEI